MAYPIVTITMADGSVMKAELYPETAPNTVNNFISLISAGFYNSHIEGIDHLILRVSRMNAPALDLYFRGGSIKTLVLQYTQFSAIYRIGFPDSELVSIKMQCSVPYFLVRRKCDGDCSVTDLRMLTVILEHIHDLSDARFVVCTQKSGAVSRDQRLSVVFGKLRKVIFPKKRIAALIVLNDPRAYIGT